MLSKKIIQYIISGMIIILIIMPFAALNARVIMKTRFLQISIDHRGYITEFRNIAPGSPSLGMDFTPAGQIGRAHV